MRYALCSVTAIMEETYYEEPTVKLLGTTASRGTVIYASIGVGIALIILAVVLAIVCKNGQHDSSKDNIKWVVIGILFLIVIPVLLLLILGGQLNLHLKRGRAILYSQYPYESYISKILDGRLDINDVLLFIGYALICIGIVSVIGVSIYVLVEEKSQVTKIAVFVSIVLGFLLIGIIMYTANPTLFKSFINGVFHKTAKKVAETESDSSCTSTK
ncbi:putative integral membrane protein [Babesia bovis T2Bo]|uniref:putative integral membrane protein n=1 Tax=Babesia bovis T2Bo TaxID=484906 RepID=UPI001DE3BFD3|nr:putative integral membrane protein [Babesia bovis T2Bo]KAG6439920.1 putative integral membrane protein [Babesia bovis T2Bo]